jgi:hypothetical protein
LKLPNARPARCDFRCDGLDRGWGLIPAWTEDIKKAPLLINAKSESMSSIRRLQNKGRGAEVEVRKACSTFPSIRVG